MFGLQKKDLYRLLLFTGLSVIGLFFFAYSSSAFYPQINEDYAIFTIIAKGWRSNILPYQGYFDHKGPIVYLINLIGISFGIGKFGVWIIEIIFCSISFEIIYKCGKRVGLPDYYNILCLIIVAISFFEYVGGATVEEWSLVFELIPLLLYINYIYRTNLSLGLMSFISGVCFGIVSLIRINNNCVICGLALGLIITFIYNRQFLNIWKSIICFILGFSLIITPFIIYFSLHNALDDLIYDNYIFNFLYKMKWSSGTLKISSIFRVIPCFLLPFITYVFDKKNQTEFFIPFSLIAIVTFLVFGLSNGYNHYYLMIIPIVALDAILSFSLCNILKTFIIIALLSPILLLIRDFNTNLKIRNDFQNNITLSGYCNPITNIIIEHIPKEDFDSIYTYGNFNLASSLLELNTLPMGKFFFMQDSFENIDKDLHHKFESDFITKKPLWIISTKDLRNIDYLYNCASNYEEITNESIFIYRRKK